MVRTSVVVSSDLLLVLGLRVHDDLGCEGEEDVLEEVEGKVEGRKVVSVLEHLEHIPWNARARTRGKREASQQMDLLQARMIRTQSSGSCRLVLGEAEWKGAEREGMSS